MKREGNFHEESMQFSGKTDFGEYCVRKQNAGTAFHNVFDLPIRHRHFFGYSFVSVTVHKPHPHYIAVFLIVDMLINPALDFAVCVLHCNSSFRSVTYWCDYLIPPVMLTSLGCKVVPTDKVLLPFCGVSVGTATVSVVGVARTYHASTGVPFWY